MMFDTIGLAARWRKTLQQYFNWSLVKDEQKRFIEKKWVDFVSNFQTNMNQQQVRKGLKKYFIFLNIIKFIQDFIDMIPSR